MNIFIFSRIAEDCAKMYGRDHYNKMIVEYCQLLCTVLCLNEHGGGIEVTRIVKGKQEIKFIPIEVTTEKWQNEEGKTIQELEDGYKQNKDYKDNPYFFMGTTNERHPSTLSIARPSRMPGP